MPTTAPDPVDCSSETFCTFTSSTKTPPSAQAWLDVQDYVQMTDASGDGSGTGGGSGGGACDTGFSDDGTGNCVSDGSGGSTGGGSGDGKTEADLACEKIKSEGGTDADCTGAGQTTGTVNEDGKTEA